MINIYNSISSSTVPQPSSCGLKPPLGDRLWQLKRGYLKHYARCALRRVKLLSNIIVVVYLLPVTKENIHCQHMLPRAITAMPKREGSASQLIVLGQGQLYGNSARRALRLQSRKAHAACHARQRSRGGLKTIDVLYLPNCYRKLRKHRFRTQRQHLALTHGACVGMEWRGLV